MGRMRWSISFLAAMLAIIALDLAVTRSLLRGHSAGSGPISYSVAISATTEFAFLGFALGVLPMASVLVLIGTSQALMIRRGGTISTFGVGFVAFGWFSVFLFMVLAALSPSAVYDYQHLAGSLFGPAINAALGESPPAWLEGAAEAILIIVAFGMPELLISLAGGWLIGRSGSRIRVEPRVMATNLSSSGQPC